MFNIYQLLELIRILFILLKVITFENTFQKNYKIKMIFKLFQKKELAKSQKKKFIPFVNQRNFMGSLLRENLKVDEKKANKIIDNKNMALIQNLKKSTKEYMFDKKYEKMAKKLKKIQDSLQKCQPNYDEEVQQCFKILKFTKAFNEKNNQNQSYYVDLKQSLNYKINTIKQNMIKKIQSQRQMKNRKQIKASNLQTQFEQNEQQLARNSSNLKEKGNETLDRSISRQIFKDVGKNSQFMTDFSNQGIKYRHLVQIKKINPWKKWYTKQSIQIFPGETITLKKLQKTIF